MWLDGDQSVGSSPAAPRDDTEPMCNLYPTIHRIADFVAAAIAVILLAPILLVTSIAIRLESRGPVLIREPALGCNNRVIKAFKFRFVTVDYSGTPKRLTGIGRILCETGIDELPHLFNVLRGEMSIADLLRAGRRTGIFRH